MSTTIYELNSTAARDGQSTGAATVTNGVTIAIGDVDPNKHAFLSFDLSGVGADEVVKSAILQVKVAALGAGTPPGATVFVGADLGAALDNADYDIFPDELAEILDGSESVGDTKSIYIPSEYLNVAGSTTERFDCEIKPTVDTVGATDSISIHSGDAISADDQPLLTIVTLDIADYLAEGGRGDALGSESYLGWNIESVPGVPVKSKSYVHLTDSTLQVNAENLESQALTQNRVRPLDMAIGKADAGGDFGFEFTPEQWPGLLLGLMKLYSTSGPTDNVYTHVLRAAQAHELKTFTLTQKEGEFPIVFPGTVMSSLEVSANLDRLITGKMAVMARDGWIFDDNAAGGEDHPYIRLASAARDDNGLLSFVGGEVVVEGVTVGDVQSLTLRLVNDMKGKRGIRRNRGVLGHYPLSFRVEVDAEVYFTNDYLWRRFLGVTHLKFPYKAGMRLTSISLNANFEGQDGEDLQEFQFSMPSVRFSRVENPINGEDAIMLRFTGAAVYDASIEGNLELTIKNGQVGTWFDADDENLIVVQPD